MEVILKSEIKGLGKVLDIVNVKPGYANNYLIPRLMAVPATKRNRSLLEADRARAEEVYLKEKADASAQAEKMKGVSVTIAARVSEGEKLYGSISSTEIVSKLKEKGFDIERKAIDLEEPIKQLGMFNIRVILHPDVDAKIKVWVINDESK